jgi:hypothetical protein
LAEQDYYSKGEQIAQDFKELAAANPEKFTAWIPKNDPVKRREYVLADGWQYIGARFGVFASTSLIERSEDGFIVECILATNDGIKVGSGIGICQLYDALTERGRPTQKDVAALGMAQTRAISRAFRARYSWVVGAAGFTTTPAEEMYGIDTFDNQDTTPPAKATRPRQAPAKAAPQQSQNSRVDITITSPEIDTHTEPPRVLFEGEWYNVPECNECKPATSMLYADGISQNGNAYQRWNCDWDRRHKGLWFNQWAKDLKVSQQELMNHDKANKAHMDELVDGLQAELMEGEIK